jgi:hypothetical protein
MASLTVVTQISISRTDANLGHWLTCNIRPRRSHLYQESEIRASLALGESLYLSSPAMH